MKFLYHRIFFFEISCLGYKTKRIKSKDLKVGSLIKIILQKDLLSLDEIIVKARKKYSKEGTSSYKIGSQSIKQIQAMNLSDGLALLPGNKNRTPDLTTTKSANLRTAIVF